MKEGLFRQQNEHGGLNKEHRVTDTYRIWHWNIMRVILVKSGEKKLFGNSEDYFGIGLKI